MSIALPHPSNPCRRPRQRLGGHRTGRGWMARCPAHDDRTPSLSIADGAEGRILLTCFAGCTWAAIRDALQARSLWPRGQQHACPATSNGAARRPHLLEAGSNGLAVVKQIWRDRRQRRPARSSRPICRAGPSRARAADPALRFSLASGERSFAALHGRRRPGSRRPPQPACTAPGCGRTGAARRM